MRLDLQLIQAWIKESSLVLDLGCGDGKLLSQLRDSKQVDGLGIEIDPDYILDCINAGISVVEQDLNKGLANFQTRHFDMVVMTHALQTLSQPHLVIDEMLRVGKECIVTFPNFGHWRCRTHLNLRGRMPVSEFMPYRWYDTPNIHFCTVDDFELLCRERGIRVLGRSMVGSNNSENWLAQTWPNLFAMTAVYHISK
jgi:methionine biosynthesis protein MetW